MEELSDFAFYAQEIGFYEEQAAEEAKQESRKKYILRAIAAVKGLAFAKEVEAYLEDSDYVRSFTLVRKPGGKYQDHFHEHDYDHIPGVWVDQYCNGGMEGDSFAGYVWIPLKNRLFLKFHYSC